MCRLFGSRSVHPRPVRDALVEADNALVEQSVRHPDGWGLAHYGDGGPKLIRRGRAAYDDPEFVGLSAEIASQTVVAHIRKATAGEVCARNAHPFRHGPWVFAHNGEIPGFERFRRALLARLPRPYLRFVQGDTDSEVCFYLFLAELARGGPLERGVIAEEVLSGLRAVERHIEEVTSEQVDTRALLLNFLVTNGEVMVATRRGKDLFWRTEGRDRLRRFFVSSEPIGQLSEPGLNALGEWFEVAPGGAVGVDRGLRLWAQAPRVEAPLPVVA